MGLGTLFVGKTTSADSAKIWAEHLFQVDPWKIKTQSFTFIGDHMTGIAPVPNGGFTFESADEQILQASYVFLHHLRSLQFVHKRARGEGDLSTDAIKFLDISGVMRGNWPRPEIVQEMWLKQVERSGRAVGDVLYEIKRRKEHILRGNFTPEIKAIEKPTPDNQQPPLHDADRNSVRTLPPPEKLLEIADESLAKLLSRPNDYWPEP